MHKFWYHSPVRFYRTLEELQDMTNPQNTQYFGELSAYQLDTGIFHRFLIPNYNNDYAGGDLSLWLNNGVDSYNLLSVIEIQADKIKYVSFKCNAHKSGRLEIRNDVGDVLFYSNCIAFVDSKDYSGKRFVRIATKHLYNRNLFDYNSPFNWVVTSIPAYCLGLSSVDTDLSTSRTGANSTLKVREAYLDEVVQYEVVARGDSNLLNFLQVHVTNNQFFIDGTQRTCIEKIDRDEFNMFGRLNFVNVKDNEGLNILLDTSGILSDLEDHFSVLGDSDEILSNNNNTFLWTI